MIFTSDDELFSNGLVGPFEAVASVKAAIFIYFKNTEMYGKLEIIQNVMY